MTSDERYDVVVIGGGPAGLTGAVVLARARRSVLVVDDGNPRNGPADGIHGFITRDGMSPTAFLAAGRAEVERYGGQVITDRAVSATGAVDEFVVTMAERPPARARRLLVTVGLVDHLPDVPGLRERWGHEVLHCTYCHGWEMRDRVIGVLATSATASDHALTWRQWSADVILFEHTAPAPAPAVTTALRTSGIRTIPGTVARLTIERGRMTGVELSDGAVLPCDALVVQPHAVMRSALVESLDLRVSENSHGARLVVDRQGLTSVPGVWAAGNVSDLGALVITSAAAGSTAGAAINNDLIIGDMTARMLAHLQDAEPPR